MQLQSFQIRVSHVYIIRNAIFLAVEVLKCEWKKLQDCHRQATVRRKTKSGDAAKKMKPWNYEELMSFLLSDLTARE